MLLSSQERRQQADIQASLGGMELALKERQAEDLSAHRRATEYIAAGELGEKIKMGKEQRKASSIARERAQQEIFVTSLKTIKEGLIDATNELAGNVWLSMGLDRMYDVHAPKQGKDVEASHHNSLYKYLRGKDVGFKHTDAEWLSAKILGYGSMETKNGLHMIKLSREFTRRMSDTQTNRHFLKAAARAGMIEDIDLALADPKGAGLRFTDAYNMLDKANKIAQYRNYLQKEEAELTYQAKEGESVDYEREIRYEFQAPENLGEIQALKGDIADDTTQAFNPAAVITGGGYGPNDQTKAYDALMKIKQAQSTDEYTYDNDYGQLMAGYVQYAEADTAFTTPIIQRQQDVSGGTGPFDFSFTQEDLKGTEQDAYSKLDTHRSNLTAEIRDATKEILKLNQEGANASSMATLLKLAEEPSTSQGRDVDLWREQERLRLLNEQMMILNQQVMETTTGQWDEWTSAFGWTDAGAASHLRKGLPGSMVTETERDRRMAGYTKTKKGHYGKGQINMDVGRNQFFAANPGATLEDYLGQPIASAIIPTDPDTDKQTGRTFGQIMNQGVQNMASGLYTTGLLLGNASKPYRP